MNKRRASPHHLLGKFARARSFFVSRPRSPCHLSSHHYNQVPNIPLPSRVHSDNPQGYPSREECVVLDVSNAFQGISRRLTQNGSDGMDCIRDLEKQIEEGAGDVIKLKRVRNNSSPSCCSASVRFWPRASCWPCYPESPCGHRGYTLLWEMLCACSYDLFFYQVTDVPQCVLDSRYPTTSYTTIDVIVTIRIRTYRPVPTSSTEIVISSVTTTTTSSPVLRTLELRGKKSIGF